MHEQQTDLWATGGGHPEHTFSPTQDHTETNETHNQSHSHLGTIRVTN